MDKILSSDERERKELATETVGKIMLSLGRKDRLLLAMYYSYALPEDYCHGEPVTAETIGKYIGEKFNQSKKPLSAKTVHNRVYLITAKLRGDREIVKCAREVLGYAKAA